MKLNDFAADLHFSTALYKASYPEYLEVLKPIAYEYIEIAKKQNQQDEIYPVVMTEGIHFDDRIVYFRDKVLQAAWSILDSQGYFMDPYYTTMSAMWCQSHAKTSSMEYHVHGESNQINAFYFIDVPDDSSVFSIYDPRPAKNIVSLPSKQSSEITLAHNIVNYTPVAGDIYFTNSWLPHSFSRNRSNQNFNFFHININVVNNPEYKPLSSEAAIII